MSVALGEDLGTTTKVLGTLRDPAAQELLQKLESKSKAERAQALAMALGAIAKDVAKMDLAEDAS